MEAHKIKRSFDENKRVFVGISPDTGTPMFMLPINMTIKADRNEALSYAANSAFSGAQAKIPSSEELKRISKHAAHIEGGLPDVWVWSSTAEPYKNYKIGVMYNLKTGKWDYFREDAPGNVLLIINKPTYTLSR